MRAGSPRLLREINDRAAIEALLRNGPLTRAELEGIIGLSKPATAQLLTRLEEEGTVLRTGLRGGGRGPRAQLWTVNGALAHVAAVDLARTRSTSRSRTSPARCSPSTAPPCRRPVCWKRSTTRSRRPPPRSASPPTPSATWWWA